MTSHVGGVTDAEALRFTLAALMGNEPTLGARPRGAPGCFAVAMGGTGRLWCPAMGVWPFVDTLLALGRSTSAVTVGCCLRDPATRKVARSWALWAGGTGRASLEGSRAPAHLVVRDGDRWHALWALREPLSPAATCEANTQLAVELGADHVIAAVDHALRPPGLGPALEVVELEAPSYRLEDVIGRWA